MERDARKPLLPAQAPACAHLSADLAALSWLLQLLELAASDARSSARMGTGALRKCGASLQLSRHSCFTFWPAGLGGSAGLSQHGQGPLVEHLDKTPRSHPSIPVAWLWGLFLPCIARTTHCMLLLTSWLMSDSAVRAQAVQTVAYLCPLVLMDATCTST